MLVNVADALRKGEKKVMPRSGDRRRRRSRRPCSALMSISARRAPR
jgi:hypothetical protein